MSALVKAGQKNSAVDATNRAISHNQEMTLSNTLAEKAYNELSKMIQNRILQGGQQIIEVRLAQRLGISRTPIRQALRVLEGEGLLQKRGSRSYFVRRVELREYLQSLKVREILEAEAVYSAAEYVSENKIHEVWKNLKIVENKRPYDILSHWQSDDEVHELFINACPNLVLRVVIRSLRVTTKLFEIENLSERLEPDSRQHEAILKALLQNDAVASKCAVRDHINSLYQFALSVL